MINKIKKHLSNNAFVYIFFTLFINSLMNNIQQKNYGGLLGLCFAVTVLTIYYDYFARKIRIEEKEKAIKCESCRKYKTMDCPNSVLYYNAYNVPHYEVSIK